MKNFCIRRRRFIRAGGQEKRKQFGWPQRLREVIALACPARYHHLELHIGHRRGVKRTVCKMRCSTKCLIALLLLLNMGMSAAQAEKGSPTRALLIRKPLLTI